MFLFTYYYTGKACLFLEFSISVLRKPVSVDINGQNCELVDGYLVDNLTHNKEAPGQVLKAGFGEGKRWDDLKNSVHQALHGSDNEQKPYKPNIFSRLARNQVVPKMGRIQTSGKQVTDKKNAGFCQLSESYPHYANNIRSGALSTTNFKKAKHYSSLLASINYITTMQQMFNYSYTEPPSDTFQKSLYDVAEQQFYESIVRSYESHAQCHHIDNYFVSSNNRRIHKSYSEKLNEIIQHVHEQAKPDSPEAQALINAVNHYQDHNLKLNDMLNIGAALDHVSDVAQNSRGLEQQKQALQESHYFEDKLKGCIKLLQKNPMPAQPKGPSFFEQPRSDSAKNSPIQVFSSHLNSASQQYVNQLQRDVDEHNDKVEQSTHEEERQESSPTPPQINH